MDLGSQFHSNPHASEAAIADALDELGRDLPADYLAFLRQSNGGEGFIAGHYVHFWKVEDVPRWSEDYLKHTEFEDGEDLTLFGGNAFGFDWTVNGAIVEAPLIGMARDAFLYCASSFAEFLRRPTGFKE